MSAVLVEGEASSRVTHVKLHNEQPWHWHWHWHWLACTALARRTAARDNAPSALRQLQELPGMARSARCGNHIHYGPLRTTPLCHAAERSLLLRPPAGRASTANLLILWTAQWLLHVRATGTQSRLAFVHRYTLLNML